MKKSELKLAITSSEENISMLGGAVHGVCSSLTMDEQSRYNVRLCVVEAVTNCVRHAYRGAPGKPIEILIRHAGHRLQVSVRDQGEPMPEGLVGARPGTNLRPPQPLSEGGRGLFLIDALMDDVEFHVDGPTNVLTMTRVIDTRAQRIGARPAAI
jgi:serine/threonine-protein kinase RsbW